MYNNDYIIAVDENGQPYIAHANAAGGAAGAGRAAWGSGTGRQVLYKAKEFINGKMRYIYDTAKRKGTTAAKKAWGSKAGRWIDSHDAGITERIMEKRLTRKGRKAYKSGNREDAMRYSRRANELRKEGRDEMNAARENIRKRTEPIRTAAKNAYGYDDQERYEQARKRYLDLQQTAKKYPDSVNKEELERRKKDMLDLQKKYMRTGKGVVDYLKARRVYRNANKK